MNPTLMCLSSVHGLLKTTAPSLDRFDERMLADIGLDQNGVPLPDSGYRVLMPIAKRGLWRRLAGFVGQVAAVGAAAPITGQR